MQLILNFATHYCTRAYTLGTYSLGTYILGQPILDLATHSLHWGLQSGDLQSGNLYSRATDFGSRNTLIALGPTVWGPTVWEPTSSGNRFWISQPTHCTGAYSLGTYSLGAYSLAQPILDLATHSLHWSPKIWGPTVWQQSQATDFGSHTALIALVGGGGPGETFLHLGLSTTVWEPTVSGHRY